MIYTADFETNNKVDDCRVWLTGIYDIYTDEFFFGFNIQYFFNFIQDKKIKVYYHNLGFDGDFIIWELERSGFKHTTEKVMNEKEYKTLITDDGIFYEIKICTSVSGTNKNITTIHDSHKLLPFSVEDIAKDFGMETLKGSIEYNKYRDKNYIATKSEISYCKTDCKIVANALKQIFEMGAEKMTIGACALEEFKNIISKKRFNKLFPPPTYDTEIRKSYKGGFTYVNPKYQKKIVGKGLVLDVNSLYPSIMYNMKIPFGEGKKYEGEYKPCEVYDLFIHTFEVIFELKKNHIPTIQIKNNLRFTGNEYLTNSSGEIVTLCLTSIDYKLFLEHYNILYINHVGGYCFKSTTGLFCEYIDKWTAVKTKAKLEENYAWYIYAKLMLNNLYGKFAQSIKGAMKIPQYDRINDTLNYKTTETEDRKPVYLPVGTFITAGARDVTIRAAQKNFKRFLYADTDSLHLLGHELPDLEIDGTKLGAWDLEFYFNRAKYLRQKTYIEEGYKPNNPDKIVYAKACAGLKKNLHHLLTIDNLNDSLTLEGQLKRKRVRGGTVLLEGEFKFRGVS